MKSALLGFPFALDRLLHEASGITAREFSLLPESPVWHFGTMFVDALKQLAIALLPNFRIAVV